MFKSRGAPGICLYRLQLRRGALAEVLRRIDAGPLEYRLVRDSLLIDPQQFTKMHTGFSVGYLEASFGEPNPCKTKHAGPIHPEALPLRERPIGAQDFPQARKVGIGFSRSKLSSLQLKMMVAKHRPQVFKRFSPRVCRAPLTPDEVEDRASRRASRNASAAPEERPSLSARKLQRIS